MSAVSSAAADVTGDFIAELQDATPGGPDDPVEETPEAEPETTEEATEDEDLLSPALPPEIEAMFAEDDDPEPEDDDPEPAAEVDYVGLDEQDAEDELRQRLHKAEKRARFLEEQQIKSSLTGWRKEAGKYFPLADIDQISGRSKREVFRQARSEHDIARRGADKVAAKYEAAIDRIVEERVKERESQMESAWGRPTSGPGQAPAEAAQKADELREINEAPTLADRITLKMRKGLLQI
jgi:hypothetical protein